MTHSADLIGRLCVAGMYGNPSPRAALRSQNQRASVGRAARLAKFTAPAGARTLSDPARGTREFAGGKSRVMALTHHTVKANGTIALRTDHPAALPMVVELPQGSWQTVAPGARVEGQRVTFPPPVGSFEIALVK